MFFPTNSWSNDVYVKITFVTPMLDPILNDQELKLVHDVLYMQQLIVHEIEFL